MPSEFGGMSWSGRRTFLIGLPCATRMKARHLQLVSQCFKITGRISHRVTNTFSAGFCLWLRRESGNS